MSLGNGNPTYGNKGSNFNYELSVLQLLSQISASAPSGGATEATALSILAAIQAGQEFEQNLVIDTGGAGCPGNCPTYLQVRIFNDVTHTFDPPIYYDGNGNVVVPVGPLQFVNPQFLLEQILAQLTPTNKSAAIITDNGGGNTPTGVNSYTISFLGSGGTLDGIPVPDGFIATFSADKNDTFVNQLPYTAPTTGEARVIITSIS